ncbi:hypothetical protein FE257_002778 [Aspergillus nanangensis]|uniref:Uncharacterized protein n=1 Tax=Aspergillus nanangensis TaxID=2582783 RepID=A0AAD4CC77_ASPNN|nr:hypothetical protein FE257_002778 [Aspergillus nanangensis]
MEVRSQLFQSFVDWYLPPSEYLQEGTGKNILQTLPDLTTSSQILDKAVTSLSSAFLARQNRDTRLLEYSTRLYGNAIQHLNRKIRSRGDLGHDVLYTTLVNCSPPGFSAWIAHVQGSNAIINQGASRKGDSTIEKLFHRQLKFVTLCDAIGKRKAAGLYKSLAWEHGSSRRTENPDLVDEIIDKLVECSALMEKVDHFVQDGNEKAQDTGAELLSSCLALEMQFHQIHTAMQRNLGVPSPLPLDIYYWKGFRSTLSTNVFLKPLDFPSLTCAECHLLYWAALILLYPLIDQLLSVLDHPDDHIDLASAYAPIRSLEGMFDSPSDEEEGIHEPLDFETSPDFTAIAEHYANEICRSVVYCVQPDMKTLGAQLLLAPLSQSAQFFYVRDLTEKYKWCQRVFTMLPQLGLGIGFFLKDMVWPKYRDSHRGKSASPG